MYGVEFNLTVQRLTHLKKKLQHVQVSFYQISGIDIMNSPSADTSQRKCPGLVVIKFARLAF